MKSVRLLYWLIEICQDSVPLSHTILMELWICVRLYRKMQILTISIMDDFCFDWKEGIQMQKLGR